MCNSPQRRASFFDGCDAPHAAHLAAIALYLCTLTPAPVETHRSYRGAAPTPGAASRHSRAIACTLQGHAPRVMLALTAARGRHGERIGRGGVGSFYALQIVVILINLVGIHIGQVEQIWVIAAQSVILGARHVLDRLLEI